jgi:UDP-glucose 4-epimerase
MTIQELAELVQHKTGAASKIVRVPYEEAYDVGFEDLGRRVPDVKKLQDMIGFHPNTPADTIVDRVIAHFKGSGEV